MAGQGEDDDVNGLLASLASELGFDEGAPSDAPGAGGTDELHNAESPPDGPGNLDSKKVEEGPAAKGNPEAAPESQKKGEEVPPKTEETSEDSAPNTWKAEEAAVWKDIPAAAKAAILRREADIFKGLEGYKAQLAAQAKLPTLVQALRQGYEEQYQRAGVTPEAQLTALIQADNILNFGTPAEKLALLRSVVLQQGLTFEELAAVDPKTDSEVLRLRAENDRLSLEARHGAVQSSQQSQENALRQVQLFFQDPANKYAEAVSPLMGKLLQSGMCGDLKTAYEQAIMMDPVVREKVLAEQQASRIAAEKAAAAKKVQDAKAAQAARVGSRPKPGVATNSSGNMFDSMDTLFQDIQSR